MMKWPTLSLGDVASIVRQAVQPKDIPCGTPFIGLENITAGGKLEGVSAVAEGELASTKFSFSAEHVLYGKLRPYLSKIALPTFDGVCSTDIIPILPGPDLDRRYLAHYLLTPQMVNLASERATGANLPRLSPQVLLEFPIPLPPLEEQRRIAAILDKAEELREKRRRAIALLDQLPQAIFLEMFGDPATNPMGWPLVAIQELVMHVEQWNPRRYSGTFEYIDISSIDRASKTIAKVELVDCEVAPSRARQLVKRGDVLVSTIRPKLNAVAKVKNESHRLTASTGLCVLRAKANAITPNFLYAVVRTHAFVDHLTRKASGASYPAVSEPTIKSYPVYRPPNQLQLHYSERCCHAEELRQNSLTALRKLEDLLQLLRQQLLNRGRHV